MLPRLLHIRLAAQLRQCLKFRLHRFEIWQILRGRGLFGVVDDSVLVDDKSGTGGGVANAGEAGEDHIIGLGGFLVEVAYKRDTDLFFLRPGFLREWTVHANADDFGVQIAIGAQTCGDVAEFLCADAGEGEWEEQKDGVFAGRQRNIAEAGGVFGLERETGGFGAN